MINPTVRSDLTALTTQGQVEIKGAKRPDFAALILFLSVNKGIFSLTPPTTQRGTTTTKNH